MQQMPTTSADKMTEQFENIALATKRESGHRAAP
jgi:hypothetical protein